jgi:hypothetical protein
VLEAGTTKGTEMIFSRKASKTATVRVAATRSSLAWDVESITFADGAVLERGKYGEWNVPAYAAWNDVQPGEAHYAATLQYRQDAPRW